MPAMLKLAAFADEIGPELDDQIRVCRDNDVTHFELRGVRGLNVLDFPADLRNEIRTKLRDNGMGVASIGSPIGKVKIDEPWDEHFDRFKIAVELAQFFAAPFIRIFSYYPPTQGGDIEQHRDEVIRRMQAKVEYIEKIARHARPRERGGHLRRARPGVPGPDEGGQLAEAAQRVRLRQLRDRRRAAARQLAAAEAVHGAHPHQGRQVSAR